MTLPINEWTIVPMRGFGAGKSRLAPVADDGQRHELNVALLGRAMAAVEGCDDGLDQCLVVSADPSVIAFAQARNAHALLERVGGGLNGALEQARRVVRGRGASSIRVIAADLPDIHADALTRLRDALPPGQAALMTDRAGTGTNGLVIPAGCDMPFCYGEDSLALHTSMLRALGIEPVVWNDPMLAFDLDWPADLLSMRAQLDASPANQGPPHAHHRLQGIGRTVRPPRTA